jgi:superfamily I DNA and/or RNA helicase
MQTANEEDWWASALKNIYGLDVKRLQTETVETTQTSTPTPAKPKIEGEMKIFAERLIYALCPPDKGYAPVIVKTVKSIYDVLEERKDFAEWFTEVKQALSLKSFQLAQVIYQCLEGLRSREARELREQWFNFLQSELRGYGML